MNKVIRLLKKPEVTDLAGEKVMVDFESGKYLLLKGVANDIWDQIDEGVTIEDICSKLLEEYEVSAEICHNEVEKFLVKLVDYQFIKLEDC